MINYSIKVQSATPGLSVGEITETRAYATFQAKEVVDIMALAKHMSSHGSVYKRSDIIAVVTQTVDCVRELILDGKIVKLGELCTITPSLSSRGAATAAEFTAANIHNVSTVIAPGEAIRDLTAEAEFNLVPLRRDQQASLKKQKGETTEGGESTGGGGSSSGGGGGSDEME